MSSLSIAANKVATVPVLAQDQNGAAIALPGALSAITSDEALGTVTVGSDGASLVITPVAAEGSFQVVATSGTLTATLDVAITEAGTTPVATTLIFDVANATFADKTS